MSWRGFQRTGVLAALFGTAAAGSLFVACRPGEAQRDRPARLPLSVAMSPGEAAGFERAVEPRRFVFPEDHGPHPTFRTEWWYVTGNLTSMAPGEKRDFGYQITLFRSALEPPSRKPSRDASAWRADTLYMGHFAITDAEGESFTAFERFSRGALGLAGARAEPFRVWLENWSLEAEANSGHDIFPLAVSAADGNVSLDLELVAEKPVVLQGDAGLSRKGASPGNASYYYSFTRLASSGTIQLGERSFRVEGTSWFDREWSTSALEPGVAGWDWFALQLADGRDLMVYRLRREDGGTDRHSAGVVVEADGTYEVLTATDFALRETSHWRSRETGVDYPSGWRLTSSAVGVELTIEPMLEAQEHTGSVLYWEGAVRLDGTSLGRSVDGRGYVELTGYETP